MNEPLVQNVRATEGPDTPLGEHAEKMTLDLPEGVRAIVMLSHEDGSAMTHSKGYAENDLEDSEAGARIISDLVGHSTAVLQGLNSHLGVVLVPEEVADAVGPLVKAKLIPPQDPDSDRPGMYL